MNCEGQDKLHGVMAFAKNGSTDGCGWAKKGPARAGPYQDAGRRKYAIRSLISLLNIKNTIPEYNPSW